MAMTAEVKDELSRLVITQVSCRRAEVSALLRFAGGLHIVAGRVVVEAEGDVGVDRVEPFVSGPLHGGCVVKSSICTDTPPTCTS